MDRLNLPRLLKSKATRRFVRDMADRLGLEGRLLIVGPSGEQSTSVEPAVAAVGDALAPSGREELFTLRREDACSGSEERMEALAFALEQFLEQRETVDGLARYSLEKQRELALLYRLGERVNNITERQELLDASVGLMNPRIPSDYVLAFLLDPCDGRWRLLDNGPVHSTLTENLRWDVLEQVLQSPSPVIYDSCKAPPPFWASTESYGSSVAVVPLRQNDELLGGMLFGRREEGNVYSAEELHLLTTLGFIFAGKLADINSLDRMLDEQERAYLEAMQSLAEALEAKDAYTARHSRRVAEFSVLLGRRIGLDDEGLTVLRQAALLHDLGKIGVPDAVLNKPQRLSDQEFEIMKGHAAQTAAIMRPLKRFPEFREIAAWHHERWDGNGYPDGLAGAEIPLAARIVAIADTWDAMTDDRIYRKGMPIEKALSIMERERDLGQWDPVLLDSFVQMVREMQAARHEVLVDMFPMMAETPDRG